jgi:hypothetical protein
MNNNTPKDAVKAVGYVYEIYTLPECATEMEWVEVFSRYDPEDDPEDVRNVQPVFTAEALSQVRKQALDVAEQTRLRLAEKYQHGIDTNTADMNGNCDWARLEGAVAVVQAIRKLAEE